MNTTPTTPTFKICDTVRRMLAGFAVTLLIALALPTLASAKATAKQALLAKVQPLANAVAVKHGWHITTDRKITTVACNTFIGKTECYGSVAVNFEANDDPNVVAVVSWEAKLVRKHGGWLVRNLRMGNFTVIS